jgi:hypothetical protein
VDSLVIVVAGKCVEIVFPVSEAEAEEEFISICRDTLHSFKDEEAAAARSNGYAEKRDCCITLFRTVVGTSHKVLLISLIKNHVATVTAFDSLAAARNAFSDAIKKWDKVGVNHVDYFSVGKDTIQVYAV